MITPFEDLTESQQLYATTCHNQTTYSMVTTRVNGLISAFASALIILVILKSQSRLSIIYHRILFGMSFADILASLAAALTTLPMPKADAYKDLTPVIGYSVCYEYWPVTRLGNVHTCEAQGLLFYFGYTTMLLYNGSLSVYYACAIAFRMPEARIRKYVEPMLHLVPISFGLVGSIIALFQKRYNPAGFEPYCTVASLCALYEDDPDIPCYRGNYEGDKDVLNIAVAGLAAWFMTIVISLTLVIWQVIALENRLNAITRKNPVVFCDLQKKNENAKTVIKQAFSYMFAMLTMLIFPALQATDFINTILIVNLKVFFMPLVGLFNFIIFMYHKIHTIRKSGDERSAWEIFVELMKGSAEEPIFLSRISILQFEDFREKVEMRMHNERGNEEVVSYAPGSQWDHLEEQQDEHQQVKGDVVDEESMVSSQMLSYQSHSQQSELRGFDQDSSQAAALSFADGSQAQNTSSELLHGSSSPPAEQGGEGSRMSSLNSHSHQADISFQTPPSPPQATRRWKGDMSMFGLSVMSGWSGGSSSQK